MTVSERHAPHRDAILGLLAATDRFRSASEVHVELLRRGSRAGMTTVYRVLHQLAEAGELDVVVLGDGARRYRRCGPAAHDHLTCRRCGRTVELPTGWIHDWAQTVADRHGFRDVDTVLQLSGVCRRCAVSAAGGQQRSMAHGKQADTH
ncbi:Fur family transcriptional regulator [Dactylosporangium sp. CA-233914]|uniref:Fur family transcriptional regulator n=1 Tax=Dactylosporangium sp. CA-233914 TaxID=3239934 RepID=UPI003D8B356D